MTAGTGPEPGTDPDDIDTWIDQLSGAKPGAGADLQVLRRAIGAHVAREQAADQPRLVADEHAWQQLRFRLRSEGLLAAPRPAWRHWLPTAAAAAVLAALLLPAVLQDRRGFEVTAGDPPMLRGDTDTVLEGPNPLARAQLLARQLAERGARPLLYFHEGTATLDFELDAANIAAVDPLLRQELTGTRARIGFNRLLFRDKR